MQTDTNNNIMGLKNKNSQIMKKVKRSTRMSQRPKRQCVECKFFSPLLSSSSFSHMLFHFFPASLLIVILISRWYQRFRRM